MAVYIPNIKIPEKCSKCRDTGLKFAIDELGLKCPERKEIWGPTEAEIKGIRRPDCPLVSVMEPHGRLGDLDEIVRYKERLVVDADKIIPEIRYVVDTKYIVDAPTIIEAEEGDG